MVIRWAATRETTAREKAKGATNPENGTVSYTYVTSGYAIGKVATRTDAKGQVVTYSYDSLARLLKVQRYPSGTSYPADACQEEDYYYDGTTPSSSSTVTSSMGHLSAVQYWGGYNFYNVPTCDTTFTELYTYGTPGAPVTKELQATRTLQWSGVGWFPYTLSLSAGYTYDNEGRITNETYPTDNSGNTQNLSYTFDSMGRLNTMTDDIAMQTVIAGTSYGPANELTAITGASGGWSGESLTYNSLKQLTGLSGGGLSVGYAYPTTGNNGKISSETDGGYSGEVVTYTYDSLNRLIAASDQPTWYFPWGQSFTYDGFGNLTNASVTQGSAPSFSQCYDVNNHPGSQDANGNPNYVPLPAYGTSATPTYDVENRLVALNGSSSNPTAFYSYDPVNKRVWRGNWTNSAYYGWQRSQDEITFWSVSGRKLATYNVTQYGTTLYCTESGTNYYFGGKLIKNASGYVYSDRLGSLSGPYFPYGQQRGTVGSNDTEKFTGYFRDAESGNDYADQRYISPGTGRFLTADHYLASAGPSDPGSWNRYAYAGGDPVNGFDPTGQMTEWLGAPSSTNCYDEGALADCSEPNPVQTYGVDASILPDFQGRGNPIPIPRPRPREPAPQVPTSFRLVSAVTAQGVNYASNCPNASYGAFATETFQVLNQYGQPMAVSSMTVQEQITNAVTWVDGYPYPQGSSNWVPTTVPGPTLTNMAGQFVDTPFGGCSTTPLLETFTQQFRVDYNGTWYVLSPSLGTSITLGLASETVTTGLYTYTVSRY